MIPVIDLFSGGGGMSFGFHAHSDFKLTAAFDAQIGKPSSGIGGLDCNSTYQANIGIVPFGKDLSELSNEEFSECLKSVLGAKTRPTVMIACPPCTGFSRANPNNHVNDDRRNSLVTKVYDWAVTADPEIILMENSRELLTGNFSHHFAKLKLGLESLGYWVHSDVHFLDRFGLPQKRERALIVAAKKKYKPRSLFDIWEGYEISRSAVTVRRAIGTLPKVVAGEMSKADSMHVSPSAKKGSVTLRRLQAIPKDGGSWVDLVNHPEAEELLTPAMQKVVKLGRFGSYPDIYGRMWWDRPAVTIKRECSHFGNGRYSHPEQDRLCTVREMSILQGFPSTFKFEGNLSNMYRHIGDAVPPIISYQIAHLVSWILTGSKPDIYNCLLADTHLTNSDIKKISVKSESMQKPLMLEEVL